MVYNQNRQHNYSNQNNQPIEAKQIPGDYVDQAEKIMQEITNQGPKITTSKIRNLLSLIIDIYNTENLRTESDLKEESVAELQLARIRIVYEYGRDSDKRNNYPVRNFINKSSLLSYLKEIEEKKSRDQLISLTHYMEALVAYHRFYGGNE